MPYKSILFLTIYIGAALGALRNPIWGICGYIFVYSILSEQVWWVQRISSYGIRYSLIMAICIFLGLILNRNKINWQILPYNNLETSLYFFVGIVGLSLLVGAQINNADGIFFHKMVNIIIFIFMLTRVVSTQKNYDKVIFIIIATGVYLSLQAFYAPSSMFVHGRLNSLGGTDFLGSNELAIHLAVVLCFLGIAILSAKIKIKIVYIVGAVFVLNAIILTRTRAIFISLFAALLYCICAAPKIYRKQMVIYVTLGGILFILLVDPAFMTRMNTIKNPGEDASANSRLVVWKASLKMLKDYPFGVGAGNFGQMIGNYSEQLIENENIGGRDAHNTFIRCYGELGIQGLFFFILIIFLFFKKLRHIQILARGTPLELKIELAILSISLAIVIYLVGGLTHTRLYTEELWWFLAMPICLEKAVTNDMTVRKVIKE